MIHTPRLCGEPIFVGQGGVDESAAEKRKKAVNVIDCRPIVKDQMLALASSPPSPPLVEAAPQQQPETVEEQAPAASREQQAPAVSREQQAPEGPTSDATPTPPTAHAPQTASANQNGLKPEDAQYLNEEMDFVLVVDPATGEMKLETSEDGSGILSEIDAGKLDGAELFSSNSLDELLDKLKDVISQTAQQLQEPAQAAAQVQAPGQPDNGQAKPASGGALRQRPLKEKVDLSKLSTQQKADQLSRLTRSGAHNHKAIAEAFVNGQKGAVRKGQNQAGQQTANQQPLLVEQQRQLGTPQYRNLKRAFEMKWDEDEEVKKRKQSVAKAAGEL